MSMNYRIYLINGKILNKVNCELNKMEQILKVHFDQDEEGRLFAGVKYAGKKVKHFACEGCCCE